jgi:penicillin G amidase
VAGFSFAGVPGVIIGHNDRIAWAFTNVGADVMDLYIEKVHPQDPLRYEVNGQWQPMELVEETIAVAGGQPETLRVRLTRHGPVVSDTYAALAGFDRSTGLELPAAHAIALRWTALEPSNTFQAIWQANRARDWEEIRAAARAFDVPSQNFLYADVDGNIGYQTPGRIPVRKSGVGRYPVPGWTDEHEWIGFVPFDELPWAFNPPEGYIVTANNAVTGRGYPHFLAADWDYGYRAERIAELIETHPGPIGLEDVRRMQGDAREGHAQALVGAILTPKLADERLQRARSLLEGWDGQLDADSAAAALFQAVWRHLLAETFDELPAESAPGGGSRWMTVVGRLLEQPDSAWWDDRRTAAVEDRDAIVLRALGAAVDELERRLGRDPDAWRWGALHTVTFKSGTFGRSGVRALEWLFNRGPYRVSGGSASVNATGWNADAGYAVRHLPSMRMIVDLGDLSRSLAIHTTGQSGHTLHRHHVDMAEAWSRIELRPMRWERAQLEASAGGRLRLVPADGP